MFKKYIVLLLLSLCMTFVIVLQLIPEKLDNVFPKEYLKNELHSFKIYTGSMSTSGNRNSFHTSEDLSKLTNFISKSKVRKRFIFENPHQMLKDKMIITIYMKDGTVNTITDHSIFWYNGPNTGKYAFYKITNGADIQTLFEDLNIRR